MVKGHVSKNMVKDMHLLHVISSEKNVGFKGLKLHAAYGNFFTPQATMIL